MNKRMRAWTVLLSTICAMAAQADVIFDNGGTLLLGGLVSTVDTHFIVADNFVLGEGSDILSDIHWFGYYAEGTVPTTDSFSVYIYSDAGGAPGTALFTYTNPVLRTDTGDLTFGAYNEFEYQMDIDPLGLTAGTTYWLGIQSNVDSNDSNWFWSIANFSGGDAHQKLQNWTNYEVEEAFYLTGPNAVVPEPASILLMGAGLTAMGIRRKSSFFSRKTKS